MRFRGDASWARSPSTKYCEDPCTTSLRASDGPRQTGDPTSQSAKNSRVSPGEEAARAAKPGSLRAPSGPSVDFTSLSIRLFERLSVRKRAPDLATLRTIVAPAAELHLLDVGGGAGSATERVANGCGEIVVLEPNPRKVALGRRQRPAIRFVQGQGEAIPFPDASFDRVLALVSFHHMPDQRKVLEEMRRVLRPGGRIALLELPPGREPGRFLRWIAGLRHGDPVAFLEPEALRERLEAAGFRDASVVPGVRSYIVTATKGL